MRPVRSFPTVRVLLVLGAFLALLSPGARAEDVRVKHILLGSPEEAAKVRAEIVQNGGDRKAFTDACRKHSKDSTTKRLGGTLDWITERSTFDPAFKAAAFELKEGETSQPVQSQFGWHLIYCMERRGVATESAEAPTASPIPTPPIPTPDTPDPIPAAPENSLVPDIEVETPPPTPRVEVTTVQRSRRVPKKVTVTLESAKRGSQGRELFQPSEAMEVNLSIKNSGSEKITVFDPAVLALGVQLTELDKTVPLTGDFGSLTKPENLLLDLEPYAIAGYEVSLNDYYKIGSGRYNVSWDKTSFFQQLESRFPEVASLPNYAAVKADLDKPGVLTLDRIIRAYPHRSAPRSGLAMAVFDRIQPSGKYFAELKLRGESTPIVIELNAAEQFMGVRHFAQLALSGFYDNLDFYDVRPGDYLLGGSPTLTGTGAPDMRLPQIRNDNNLKHERGTVSFVSRSIRKGPVKGGEVGSIFFVLLKAHPEWDQEHVPFGEVVSGLEVLEKVATRMRFESITIVTEAEQGEVAVTTKPLDADTETTTGNPEVKVTTPKGELVVELYERDARNTVANFITLAEKGFYNKQSFFNLMKDADGKRLSIQTGSPTNDGQGGAGYTIRAEPNTRKHVRGALSMMQKYVEADGQFVPDSASSQYFICLSDLPYFDTYRLTVFGAVKSGMDVLDKLEDGDTIETVEVTKKRDTPYDVRKNP